MSQTINILIVDDHEIVRTALNFLFADIKGISIVGTADSARDGVRLARSLNPDMVLLDLRMPGIDGLEATKKILAKNPKCRILILTAYCDSVYPSRLLSAGASGYITKNTSKPELIRAVRLVHSGKRYICPDVAKTILFNSIDNAAKKTFEKLSDRELQIALLISQGYKSKDIAEQLHLELKTINTYRYSIQDKLGKDGDVKIAHLAIKYGLIEPSSMCL